MFGFFVETLKWTKNGTATAHAIVIKMCLQVFTIPPLCLFYLIAGDCTTGGGSGLNLNTKISVKNNFLKQIVQLVLDQS